MAPCEVGGESSDFIVRLRLPKVVLPAGVTGVGARCSNILSKTSGGSGSKCTVMRSISMESTRSSTLLSDASDSGRAKAVAMRQLTVGRGERRVVLFDVLVLVLVEAGGLAVRMEGSLRSFMYLMACMTSSTPSVETSEKERLVAGIVGLGLLVGLLMSGLPSAFVHLCGVVRNGEHVSWKKRKGPRVENGKCLEMGRKVHDRTKRLFCHHSLGDVEIRGSSSQAWDKMVIGERIGLVAGTWSNT